MTAPEILWLTLWIELAILPFMLYDAPDTLLVYYWAIMNLKRVRDDGKKGGPGLSPAAVRIGTRTLIRGYVYDFLVNAVHMTWRLKELPRELTVTRRLRRHIESNTKYAAYCLEMRTQLLDGFDPNGIHQ